MASNPQFINTPRISYGEITTGQTARTTGTTTNLVDVMTGATGGTRIIEVVTKATGQAASSLIQLWLFDGTSNILFDEFGISTATGSTTAASGRSSTTYSNLLLPSSSWKLVAGCTVTPTSGNLLVWALGGDLV